MPEKYLRHAGPPILLRHTGATTLPEQPPFPSDRLAPDKDKNGGGEAIICLHDAGLQSSVFDDLLQALEHEGLKAIAFDFPGHDRSGGLDALDSIESMSALAAQVADWCGIERALVLGHGMGALVGIDWALREPNRVESLALCGAGTAFSLTDDAIDLMRRVSRGKAPRPFDPSRVCRESSPEMMRRAFMEGIRTDPRTTLGDLEACRTWIEAWPSKQAHLGERPLPCQTLFLEGEAEPKALRDAARARLGCKEDTTGDTTLVGVQNAAHFLPLEQPERCAQALYAFYDEALVSRQSAAITQESP